MRGRSALAAAAALALLAGCPDDEDPCADLGMSGDDLTFPAPEDGGVPWPSAARFGLSNGLNVPGHDPLSREQAADRLEARAEAMAALGMAASGIHEDDGTASFAWTAVDPDRDGEGLDFSRVDAVVVLACQAGIALLPTLASATRRDWETSGLAFLLMYDPAGAPGYVQGGPSDEGPEAFTASGLASPVSRMEAVPAADSGEDVGADPLPVTALEEVGGEVVEEVGARPVWVLGGRG